MAQGQVNAIKASSGLTLSNQATDSHILFGYQVFTQNGVIITGTIPDLGNLGTRTLGDGESYTINKSYVGNIVIRSKSLEEQTEATAISNDILYGKTAWVNGELVTGTLDSHIIENDYVVTLVAGSNYIVPEGYYTNSFTVQTKTLAEQTQGDATSEDITVDRRAWVNGELIIGTMDMSSSTQATATPDKILIGETAWVNGELITGTMPICRTSDEPEIIEVRPGESYSITAGYYEEGSLTVINETLPFLTGTAVAEDVLEGKSIYIDNLYTEGTMRDYGDHIISVGDEHLPLDAGLHHVVEKPGYYHSITVDTTPLADQTVGTATAGSMMEGRTAWVNGELITGTMPIISSNSIISADLGISISIPPGYYNGTQQISAPSLSEITPGTAIDNDVVEGKTAWVNGVMITGTIPNKGPIGATINCGGSYTIPAGYYATGGTVTASSLASQTVADAVAGDILSNKTAWVNGTKIVGTILNKGAPNQALNCGGTYNIAAGYYSGGKVTANTLASQTSANAGAGDIKRGKTAWINGNKLTGTLDFNFRLYGANEGIILNNIPLTYLNTSNKGDGVYIDKNTSNTNEKMNLAVKNKKGILLKLTITYTSPDNLTMSFDSFKDIPDLNNAPRDETFTRDYFVQSNFYAYTIGNSEDNWIADISADAILITNTTQVSKYTIKATLKIFGEYL